MRKIDWFLVLLIAFFIIAGLAFIFRPGGEDSFGRINNVIGIIISLFTVIISFWLVRKLGTSGLQAKAVFFLALGFLCWLIADLLWIIYANAVVSPADIFYILGYALVFVGIVYGVRISTPDIFKNKARGAILLLAVIIAVGVYFYFFPFAWNSEISFLENLLISGYVIADLLLIIPLIFLCYSLLAGKLSVGWILISAGIVLSLVADLWYAKNYELYESGAQVIDLLWYAGYLLYAYAMMQFKRANDNLKESLLKKKQD